LKLENVKDKEFFREMIECENGCNRRLCRIQEVEFCGGRRTQWFLLVVLLVSVFELSISIH